MENYTPYGYGYGPGTDSVMPGSMPGDPTFQPMHSYQMGNQTGFAPLQIPGMSPQAGMAMQPMLMLGLQAMGVPMQDLGPMTGQMPGYAFAMRNRQDYMQLMRSMQGETDKNRLNAMFLGINQSQNGGVADAKIIAHSQQQAEMVNSLMANPFANQALGMVGQAMGVDLLSMIRPQAAMAPGVFRAGMGVYRGGGQFGMSGAEVADLTDRMMTRFAPDGRTDFAETRGFSTGQLGDIAASLQSHGMLYTPTARMKYKTKGDKDELDMSDAETKLAVDEIKNGRGITVTTGAQAQGQLASMNASAISDKVKQTASLLDLVRELSGDPNSPIEKLVQMTQNLSGGGLGQVSMGQVEQNIDRMREIAKMAGMTMDAMAGLVQQGSAMLRARGVSGLLAPTITMESVLAGTVGQEVVNQRMKGADYIGRPTRESIEGQSMSQQGSFAASAMGNQLGAAYHTLKAAAAARDMSMDDLAKGDPLLQELVQAGSGNVSSDFYKKTYGQAGVDRMAQSLAKATGMDYRDARQMLMSREAGQLGLAETPELAANAVKYQASELLSAGGLQQRIAATAEYKKIENRLGLTGAAAAAFQEEMAMASIAQNGTDAATNIEAAIRKAGGVNADAVIKGLGKGELRDMGEIFMDRARQSGRIYGIKIPELAATLEAIKSTDFGQAQSNAYAKAEVDKIFRDTGIGKAGFMDRVIQMVQDTDDPSVGKRIRKLFNDLSVDGASFSAPQSLIDKATNLRTAEDRLAALYNAQKAGDKTVTIAQINAVKDDIAKYAKTLGEVPMGGTPQERDAIRKATTAAAVKDVYASNMTDAEKKEMAERIGIAVDLHHIEYRDAAIELEAGKGRDTKAAHKYVDKYKATIEEAKMNKALGAKGYGYAKTSQEGMEKILAELDSITGTDEKSEGRRKTLITSFKSLADRADSNLSNGAAGSRDPQERMVDLLAKLLEGFKTLADKLGGGGDKDKPDDKKPATKASAAANSAVNATNDRLTKSSESKPRSGDDAKETTTSVAASGTVKIEPGTRVRLVDGSGKMLNLEFLA